MTFAAPLLLAGLALVPLLAVAYVLAQRRRRRYAVRYTNVDLLATVAGRSWGRHVPALLALLALAALVVALARPRHTVTAERRQATVVLVSDTSGSMRATDVRPTRLAAAQAAARTFAHHVPEAFRLGLVRFSSVAEQLAEPTTDHARVIAAVNGLRAHGHTAIGDGLALALDSARTPVVDPLGTRTRLPAALVLLSDGGNTAGQDPMAVAQRAKRLGVRIYTVALGTRTGVLLGHAGKRTPVPPDARALQTIARDTGGQFFAAPDAKRLESIYAGLATRLSRTRERREVTSAFAGGALALLLLGTAVGMVRGGRLP